MYIDFHKFNYGLVPPDERQQSIERDKRAYGEILMKWIQEHMEEIIQRKWEIRDIFLVEETSDFIKLLKEAETLYELGFYTSCIALVGVSAEDFTKFLCIKVNKSEWNNGKRTHNDRLNNLRADDLIDEQVYHLLDNIRKIRNGCLHYNEAFKKKDDDELKTESLTVLNDFKEVFRLILGLKGDISSMDTFINVIQEASQDTSSFIKGFDDTKYRLRNAVSQLLGMDLTFTPDIEEISDENIFRVGEIDLSAKEIELFNLQIGMPVFVDLTEKDIDTISELNIQENDIVHAVITSEISSEGLSGEWTISQMTKLNDGEE